MLNHLLDHKGWNTYFHQSLGVITSPLLETSALWKAAQAGKWRNSGNPLR